MVEEEVPRRPTSPQPHRRGAGALPEAGDQRGVRDLARAADGG